MDKKARISIISIMFLLIVSTVALVIITPNDVIAEQPDPNCLSEVGMRYNPNEDIELNVIGINGKIINRSKVYNNVENVYEDGCIKKFNTAKSLKGKGYNTIYIENDSKYLIDVLDFNSTYIEMNLSVIDSEKNKDIPIKVWKVNESKTADELTGDFKKDWKIVKEEVVNFVDDKEKKSKKYDLFDGGLELEIGDIIEFGANSTIIVIEGNQTTMEDSPIISGSPASTNFGNDASGIGSGGRYQDVNENSRWLGKLIYFGDANNTGNILINASFSVMTDIYLTSGDMEMIFQNVTGTWVENTVTWNTQPTYTTAYNISSLTGVTASGRYQFDFDIGTVKGWMFGTNNGMMHTNPKGETGGINNLHSFRNSEHATPEARPVWYLEYSAPNTAPDDPTPININTTIVGGSNFINETATINFPYSDDDADTGTGYVSVYKNGVAQYMLTISSMTSGTLQTIEIHPDNFTGNVGSNWTASVNVTDGTVYNSGGDIWTTADYIIGNSQPYFDPITNGTTQITEDVANQNSPASTEDYFRDLEDDQSWTNPTVSTNESDVPCVIHPAPVDIVQCSPTNNFTGMVIVTLIGNDSNGGTATLNYEIEVTANDDAPWWSTIQNQYGIEDIQGEFNLSAFGNDVEDPPASWVYDYINNDSSIVSIEINNATGNLSWIPVENAFGNVNISVIMYDTGTQSSQSEFNLELNGTNDVPNSATILKINATTDSNLTTDDVYGEFRVGSDVDSQAVVYNISWYENGILNFTLGNLSNSTALSLETLTSGNTTLYYNYSYSIITCDIPEYGCSEEVFSSNLTIEQVSEITVDLIYPENNFESASNTITFQYLPLSESLDNCSLTIAGGTYSNTTLTTNITHYETVYGLSDGVDYNWNVSCFTTSGLENSSSRTVKIRFPTTEGSTSGGGSFGGSSYEGETIQELITDGTAKIQDKVIEQFSIEKLKQNIKDNKLLYLVFSSSFLIIALPKQGRDKKKIKGYGNTIYFSMFFLSLFFVEQTFNFIIPMLNNLGLTFRAFKSPLTSGIFAFLIIAYMILHLKKKGHFKRFTKE